MFMMAPRREPDRKFDPDDRHHPPRVPVSLRILSASITPLVAAGSAAAAVICLSLFVTAAFPAVFIATAAITAGTMTATAAVAADTSHGQRIRRRW